MALGVVTAGGMEVGLARTESGPLVLALARTELRPEAGGRNERRRSVSLLPFTSQAKQMDPNPLGIYTPSTPGDVSPLHPPFAWCRPGKPPEFCLGPVSS